MHTHHAPPVVVDERTRPRRAPIEVTLDAASPLIRYDPLPTPAGNQTLPSGPWSFGHSVQGTGSFALALPPGANAHLSGSWRGAARVDGIRVPYAGGSGLSARTAGWGTLAFEGAADISRIALRRSECTDWHCYTRRVAAWGAGRRTGPWSDERGVDVARAPATMAFAVAGAGWLEVWGWSVGTYEVRCSPPTALDGAYTGFNRSEAVLFMAELDRRQGYVVEIVHVSGETGVRALKADFYTRRLSTRMKVAIMLPMVVSAVLAALADGRAARCCSLWGWRPGRWGLGAWCAGGVMAAGGPRGTRNSSGGRPEPATAATRSRSTRPCTKRRRAGATRRVDASCALTRSRRSPSPSADTCACVRAAASAPWQRRTRGVLCAAPPSLRRPSASSSPSVSGERDVSVSTGCRSDPAAVPRMTQQCAAERPRALNVGFGSVGSITRRVAVGADHVGDEAVLCQRSQLIGSGVGANAVVFDMYVHSRSREQPRHDDHVRYASDTEGIRGWVGCQPQRRRR